MFSYIQAVLRLTRVGDALAVFLATVLGAVITGISDLSVIATMSACIVALFCASMAFNDYFDIAEDAINAPSRPLVNQALPRWAAMVLACLLFAISLVAAATLSSRLLLATSIAIALSMAYSLWLKDVPVLGNLSVALVSTFAFGCWGLYGPVPSHFWAICIALLSIRLGGEFLKTAQDRPGDSIAGRRTLATLVSTRCSIHLGLIALLCGIAFALSVAIIKPTSITYVLVMAVCSLLILWGYLIAKNETQASVDRLVTIERTVTSALMVAVFLGLTPALTLL